MFRVFQFNVIVIFKIPVPVLQVSFPVDYTPRKFVIHHESAHLIITETEHNAYTEDTKKQRRIQMAEVCVQYLLLVFIIQIRKLDIRK
jgi:splicing factor 3B subunit 3